jgi:hypothetical protein
MTIFNHDPISQEIKEDWKVFDDYAMVYIRRQLDASFGEQAAEKQDELILQYKEKMNPNILHEEQRKPMGRTVPPPPPDERPEPSKPDTSNRGIDLQV